MCNNLTDSNPSCFYHSAVQRHQPKRSKVQVHRLTRKKKGCEERVGKDMMELKNLKLFLENRSILEENEKLRKKAILLHQENLTLMSELQQKLSLKSIDSPQPLPFTKAN